MVDVITCFYLLTLLQTDEFLLWKMAKLWCQLSPQPSFHTLVAVLRILTRKYNTPHTEREAPERKFHAVLQR